MKVRLRLFNKLSNRLYDLSDEKDVKTIKQLKEMFGDKNVTYDYNVIKIKYHGVFNITEHCEILKELTELGNGLFVVSRAKNGKPMIERRL